ncbi:MAG TPA: thioredoxin-dependent thiol peroxidase [Saprospiraceae bacterium]|jgi:peroxiredoxin Q/BCP|nr:thioredoxin-dependent thiol peroxidase [Saprospiraceae bacterium]HQW94922.1 thioredoxin-dependent thiol peroxidase [Saprospiraceae bacterium]
MSLTLSIGDKAPDFNLLDQYGKNISLSSFLGNELAIFFYPKDNTPTCTTEVCNLRDYYADLKNEGIEVVGISPDSVKSHLNFATKHNLPYTLLSDENKDIAVKYGVWGEKQMYGRKYMGIIRTTFLIDAEGKIKLIFDKVISKDHANQILKNL